MSGEESEGEAEFHDREEVDIPVTCRAQAGLKRKATDKEEDKAKPKTKTSTIATTAAIGTSATTKSTNPQIDPSHLFLDLSEVNLSLRGDSLDSVLQRLESTPLEQFETAHAQSYGAAALANEDGKAREQHLADRKKCQKILLALRRIPRLQKLELRIHGWPIPCLELAFLLAQNNLQHLTLSGGQLEAADSTDALQGCYGLSVASSSLHVLCSAFQGHASLMSLSLEGLRGNHCWDRLLPIIATACPKLQDFSLKFEDSLERQGLGGALVELSASKTLKKLHLSNVPFLSSDEFYGLLEALEDNTSLTNVSLHTNSFWKIEEGGVEAVGEMLQENKTLQFLSVSVEDTKAFPIVQALQSNRTLQRLQLRIGNWVRSATLIRAWEAMLKDNYVLRQVDVTGRTWNGKRRANVGLYLRLNSVGRHHLIESGNATREDWLKVIIDQKDNVRIVQYLLSKNPSLCRVPLDIIMEERPTKRQKVGDLLY